MTEKEEILDLLRSAAVKAMAGGYRNTAFNLSFIGMAFMDGEDCQLELGVAMTPVVERHKLDRNKSKSDVWPDEIRDDL
jgi:hypothetical protein